MAHGMGSHQVYGPGDRVDAEVGYGLPVGARFVGTPRVGLATSHYGRDYRVRYGLGVLEQGRVNFKSSASTRNAGRARSTARPVTDSSAGPRSAGDAAPGRKPDAPCMATFEYLRTRTTSMTRGT